LITAGFIRFPKEDLMEGELQEQLARALGQAVIKLWSKMPHDVQHDLFEEALAFEGEAFRQRLAVFLHGQHARTWDSMKARAMPEPDSPGG
jgi:hypothetical protein